MLFPSEQNRIPKEKELAKQWSALIEPGCNSLVCGSICIEHFTENDLSRRPNQRIYFKSKAIPSIFPESFVDPTENFEILNDTEKISQSVANDCTDFCEKCVEKDALYSELKTKSEKGKEKLESQVEEMTKKIANLKRNIINMRSRAYYMEKTKTKLQQVIKEMKQLNLIDSELQNAIQVHIHF